MAQSVTRPVVGANWLERAIEFVSPSFALKRSYARMGMEMARGYDAAKVGRRTSGWQTSGGSANAELAMGLARIRNRARDMVRNNEYAKRAVGVFCSNVVGYGVTITPQHEGERKVWREWTDGTDCDADGNDCFAGLLNLLASERYQSGEVLIRRRWRRASDGFRIPMQIQVLEPDFLDDSKTGPMSNGNYCILGKEFNAYGVCVAYWLFPEHPGEVAGNLRGLESRRVPASEVIHYFKRDRPSAVRGVSELAVSLMRYRDLSDYEEAELIRKKMEACVVALISSDKPDTALGLPGEKKGTERMSPGLIGRVGTADRVTFNNPTPSAGGGEFTRYNLHALAVGSGITYAQLTGDMSQANFASNRMGLIEFRNMVDQAQWLELVPKAIVPIRRWFQEAATLAGIPLGEVAGDKIAMPRRHMVNPLQDTLTLKEQMTGGIRTLSEILGEEGTDLDTYIATRKEELRKLEEAGIVLDTNAAVTELKLTGKDLLAADAATQK